MCRCVELPATIPATVHTQPDTDGDRHKVAVTGTDLDRSRDRTHAVRPDTRKHISSTRVARLLMRQHTTPGEKGDGGGPNKKGGQGEEGQREAEPLIVGDLSLQLGLALPVQLAQNRLACKHPQRLALEPSSGEAAHAC